MSLIAAAALALASAQAASTPPPIATPPSAAAPRPADVATPEAIVAALYDVISGPAGQTRDWDRFRSLFAKGALMTATARNSSGALVLRSFTPEDYVARNGPYLVERGFFEREVSRKAERYAQVAHVFSTYEARSTAGTSTPPMMRGINSIQLVNDGSRWWVQSIAWSQESTADPIPAGYLAR